MTLPISLSDVTTGRAGAARIPRVHADHGNPLRLRLVVDEAAKFGKGPRGERIPLGASENRDPVSYAAQVFQGDSATGAFCSGYDLFGDHVVLVPCVSLFFLSSLLEETAGRLRSLGLQLRPESSVTVTNRLQCRRGEDLPIGGNGEVDDSQVHAKKAFGIGLRRFVGLDREVEAEPLLVGLIAQIGLAKDRTLKLLRVVSADRQLDLLAARQEGHRNDGDAEETKDAAVECDSSVRGECPLRLLVQLVGVGGLRDCSASQLRRKAEPFANLVINEAVETNRVKLAGLPCYIGRVIASRIERLHRSEEFNGLFGCRLQRAGKSGYHFTSIVAQISHSRKVGQGLQSKPLSFLPIAKARGLQKGCRMIDLRFKALPVFPPPSTTDRKSSSFRSAFTGTLKLLENELYQLAARGIVIEAGFALADLRNDGWPRSGARPTHPGIVLRFESGDQQFAMPCDTYLSWTDNLRAIALVLEALRKIDRYGVTRKREQYQGFAALPASPAGYEKARAAAGEFVDLAGIQSGERLGMIEKILTDPVTFDTIHRKAVFRLHPDLPGGDNEAWLRMVAAADTIEAHHDRRQTREEVNS